MTSAAIETRAVVVERDIAHPPEKLWRALTQPHLIEEWLMKNDFAPTVGHRFNLRGEWGGVLDCEVLVVEPNRELSYTWNFRHDDAAFNLESVVKLTFARGASLDDPSRMFNSSLEGNMRRAIDIPEGGKIDEKALKALIRAAVALNLSKKSR